MNNIIIDTISSGFGKLIPAIIGAIIGWLITTHYNRKITLKAKLYYPLYLSCDEILDVTKNYKNLGESVSRSKFKLSLKTLDDIIYKYGTIIYLKEIKYLKTFRKMKDRVYQNLEYMEANNWETVCRHYEEQEFEKEIEKYASVLLDVCKNKEKTLKKLRRNDCT